MRITIYLMVFTSIVVMVCYVPASVNHYLLFTTHRVRRWYHCQRNIFTQYEWTLDQRMPLMIMSAGVLSILTWLVSQSVLWTLSSVAAGCLLPRALLSALRARRLEQAETHLPQALELFGSTLRSGQPLAAAIATVAVQSPPPLAHVFQRMLQEHRLGLSLDHVLRNAQRYLPSQFFILAMTAVLVCRDYGGDLPETFARTAAAIRELHRLEQKKRIATAEGRKTLPRMMACAGLSVVTLAQTDPQIWPFLTQDPVGKSIAIGALLLMMGAFLRIRHLVATAI
jgi:tight adherence protein B